MPDPDDLVSVYRAANLAEAHLIKNLLLDDGINAAVSEENEPFAGLNVVPPDVLVLRKDIPAAETIIRNYEAQSRDQNAESDEREPDE